MRSTDIKIKIVAVFLSLGVMFFDAPEARAEMWGSNVYAALIKNQLEKINRYIEGALLGSLKMTAMNMLNQQINQLIGGGASGRPLFITDWREELIANPEEISRRYINDVFTLSTRGMGSSLNYVGVNDFGVGMGPNFAEQLTAQAEATLFGSGMSSTTLQDFGGVQAVEQGSWRAFNEMIQNPLNNPIGFSMSMEQAYNRKLEEEMKIAEAQAIAYGGFKGATAGENGQVTAPGSTLKDLYSNSQDIGNKIIAGADNPVELASSLVAAQVNKAVNGLVQQGIGTVQSKILREVGVTSSQASALINGATSVLGPGAKFLPEVQREATIKFRAATNPPVYTDP